MARSSRSWRAFSAGQAGTSSRSSGGENWDPLLEKTGPVCSSIAHERNGGWGLPELRGTGAAPTSASTFLGKYPGKLPEPVRDMSDEELWRLRRGGHDPQKVCDALPPGALEHTGSPTVILAKTVKGYGLGEAGEGRNITHQQKKLNEEEMEEFCPAVRNSHPAGDGPYGLLLPSARGQPGNEVPARAPARPGRISSRTQAQAPPLADAPRWNISEEMLTGSGGREVSTTMALVRLLTLVLRHPEIGRYVVPIVPDEARTFGMEALFRQIGIYSAHGQLYRPADQENVPLITRRPKTGRSCRRELPRPAPWLRSPQPAPPGPTSVCP